jgi:hypothetical protein
MIWGHQAVGNFWIRRNIDVWQGQRCILYSVTDKKLTDSVKVGPKGNRSVSHLISFSGGGSLLALYCSAPYNSKSIDEARLSSLIMQRLTSLPCHQLADDPVKVCFGIELYLYLPLA